MGASENKKTNGDGEAASKLTQIGCASGRPLDIEHELAVLASARKRICANEASAREFLIRSGFLTKDLELAPRYR